MASRFLDDFKNYKEFDLTDTSQDEIMNLVLDASESYIENECNIILAESTKTLNISGNGTNTIYLDASPINSIVSVKIDDVIQDINDFVVINNHLYYKVSTFTSGALNVLVAITTGYSPTSISNTLKLAILKLADKLFTDATDNRDGVTGYDTGIKMGEHYVHSDLPDNIKAILYQHKRWVL